MAKKPARSLTRDRKLTRQPDTVMMDITPEIAGDWLSLNTHNRKLRERRVRRYAKEMADGQWVNNGETIKFDWNGVLLDGQHRLAAVVYSKKTVKMLVARGLDPSTYDTIDTGIARSAADALFVSGKMNSAHLASALGVLYRYKTTGTFTRVPGVDTPTHRQLEELLDENENIEKTLNQAYALSRKLNISLGVAATCIYTTNEINDIDSGLFWDYLLTGEDLKNTSPIYRLRERLMSKAKLKADEMGALCLKAWNLHRENKTVQVLMWRSTKEPMPKPI